MTIHKRILVLLCLFSILLVLLLLRGKNTIESAQTWNGQPRKTTLNRPINVAGDGQRQAPIKVLDQISSFKPVQEKPDFVQEPSPFLSGKAKPPGSKYTKAVILGRLSTENVTWLDSADLSPTIAKFVYNVDTTQPELTSPSSPTVLQLPKPKGHEAMVYLTYIIDNYDNLADINIFLHAHQLAWHNNEMLNHDAVEMITRLSSEHVTREGYMNLRCHWKPGCPAYIHPATTYLDDDKKEEAAMAAAWSIMFPEKPLPKTLAAPCCAQFAVSRDRIREIPLSTFHNYRNWLLDTKLDDAVSGRVFEYLWHEIFTGQSEVCPDMRVCYCDGYGVCFEDDVEFDYWFELRYLKRRAEKKLEEWWGLARQLEQDKLDGMGESLEGMDLKVPDVDGDVVLIEEIDGYGVLLEEKRLRALEAGTDPRVRAKVAGREWRDGDGY